MRRAISGKLRRVEQYFSEIASDILEYCGVIAVISKVRQHTLRVRAGNGSIFTEPEVEAGGALAAAAALAFVDAAACAFDCGT